MRQKVVVALAALSLSTVAANAQGRTLYNSDQIPREFVLALLMVHGGTSEVPDLLVGAVPRGLGPRIFVPEGARMLGSMMSLASASILYESSLPVDSLRSLIERSLPRHGWRAMAPPGDRVGGFRPARLRTSPVYCAGSDQLTFQLIRRGGQGTLVRMHVTDDDERCAPIRMTRAESDAAYLRLPTLVNPRGAETPSPACLVGAGNGTTSRTTVETSISSDSLLAHYDRQLADSGWKAAPAPRDHEVSRSWTRRTAVAEETATITVSSPSERPACKTLTLQVRRSR